jgi:hypothetical protein
MSKNISMKNARTKSLISELKKGERSWFVPVFERGAFLKSIHRKHTDKGTCSR